jgi:predicted HTH transcriptional regulator
MNLDDVGSGGLGGLIGGGLILLKDVLFGVGKKITKLETKIDADMLLMSSRLEQVVNHKTCEAIREDTKSHIQDMKEDMRYIRQRLDDVMGSVQRHREDYPK